MHWHLLFHLVEVRRSVCHLHHKYQTGNQSNAAKTVAKRPQRPHVTPH